MSLTGSSIRYVAHDRGINSALEEREEELFVLGRHELIVATPGAKDILTTDKEFKAFKGFEVIVKT